MSALRIAITVDALALDAAAAADVSGVLEAVTAVETTLAELGHVTYRVPVGDVVRPTLALLIGSPPDLVFNLCETVHGRGEGEARLIAARELAGIPVTGASAELAVLARRKDVLGALLAERDLPVPLTVIASDAQPPADWDCFPCIVKPAAADGSIGIAQDSVARDANELVRALAGLRAHAPLLVQELLTGRELNIGFVAGQVLPIAEIEYTGVPAGMWPIVDYAAKWEPDSVSDRMTVPRCPAALEPALAASALELGRAAWEAAGGCGYGRVDLRADLTGRRRAPGRGWD
ncbi:MAG: hypothetical protein FIB01_02305 [Gemmatimonadetes bacterium]|nr:hypothetical protein [Gemmatimonadota bacterium]